MMFKVGWSRSRGDHSPCKFKGVGLASRIYFQDVKCMYSPSLFACKVARVYISFRGVVKDRM